MAVCHFKTGILYASEKGSKTRKIIKDKANKGTDVLKEKFSSLVESMSDKYENSCKQKKN